MGLSPRRAATSGSAHAPWRGSRARRRCRPSSSGCGLQRARAASRTGRSRSRLDGAVRLVDPPAELLDERELKVRRRRPGLNAPRRLGLVERLHEIAGVDRLLALPHLHVREQRDRLGDDEAEGDRRPPRCGRPAALRRASTACSPLSSGSVAGPVSSPSANIATTDTAVSSHIQSIPASKRKAATSARSAATAARSLLGAARQTARARDEARHEEGEQEREPDEAELAERLQVERVRVADEGRDGGVLGPPRLVGAGPAADDRAASATRRTAELHHCQRPLPLVEKRCSCTEAPVSSGGISLKFS